MNPFDMINGYLVRDGVPVTLDNFTEAFHTHRRKSPMNMGQLQKSRKSFARRVGLGLPHDAPAKKPGQRKAARLARRGY